MTERLGAVVVNFRSARQSAVCAASLAAEGVGEVVVVDNDTDKSCRSAVEELSPGTRVIEMGVNLGYGTAANRGVAALGPRIDRVLVCNPDLEFAEGSTGAMAAVFDEDPSVGIVGPRVVSPDGSIYPSARRFPDPLTASGHALLGIVAPRNRFTRRYRMEENSGQERLFRAKVDWVSGSCMAVRRDVFESVGGFDESYFMYMEDVDLCRRVREAGWEVVYEPGARVVHTQGVSTGSRRFAMVVEHHRSAIRYSTRTLTGLKRTLVPGAVAVLVTRGSVALAREAVRRGPGRSGRRAEPRL